MPVLPQSSDFAIDFMIALPWRQKTISLTHFDSTKAGGDAMLGHEGLTSPSQGVAAYVPQG
jgi:hypothetical protein